MRREKREGGYIVSGNGNNNLQNLEFHVNVGREQRVNSKIACCVD